MRQFGLRSAFVAFCLSGFCFSVQENIRLVIWFGQSRGGGSLQIISCSYFWGPLCSRFVWVLRLLLLFSLPKLFRASGMGSETLPNALGYYFM